MNSGENKVYGTAEEPALHFNTAIAEAIRELKDQFPAEYASYYEGYRKAAGDEVLERKKYLINPLNYIGTAEQVDAPEHYRIRVGASDADTSLSVSMTLACKLVEAGKDVDYELVWDQPHSQADYAGEVISWIEKITR
jgi:acetyl esterase/lipase